MKIGLPSLPASIGVFLALLLQFSPGDAAGTTTAGTEVTVRILGETVTELPKTLTVWGDTPLSFQDTIDYFVATVLNDYIGPGMTPAPGSDTPPKDWSVWVILGLVGGTVILIIALFIWFGVDINTLMEKVRPGKNNPPSNSQTDPSSTPGEGHVYPPPHIGSKVIQIPLVSYRPVPVSMC